MQHVKWSTNFISGGFGSFSTFCTAPWPLISHSIHSKCSYLHSHGRAKGWTKINFTSILGGLELVLFLGTLDPALILISLHWPGLWICGIIVCLGDSSFQGGYIRENQVFKGGVYWGGLVFVTAKLNSKDIYFFFKMMVWFNCSCYLSLQVSHHELFSFVTIVKRTQNRYVAGSCCFKLLCA